MASIDAWSLSALHVFESCAFRSYLKSIKKAPQPELGEDHPMVRGRRIHTEVEEYISGKSDAYPSSGKKLKDDIELCRDAYKDGLATVEEKWGFTEEWDSVGWFEDGIWCRMATDACIEPDPATAIIYDWKTGKSFGNEVKYMQQMQLYAIGAFMRSPSLEFVDVHLGFLDDGKVRSKPFRRDAKLNRLIAKFTERGNRMVNCVDFRPNPNVHNCKWCPFGPSGTNVCIYGVEPL